MNRLFPYRLSIWALVSLGFCGGLLAAGTGHQKGFIVYQGEAASIIALPQNPSVSVIRGAREIQRVVERVSGAQAGRRTGCREHPERRLGSLLDRAAH